jgi:hypothetical protein
MRPWEGHNPPEQEAPPVPALGELPKGVLFDPGREAGAGEPEASTDPDVREVPRPNQLIQGAARNVQKLGGFHGSQERFGEGAAIARI